MILPVRRKKRYHKVELIRNMACFGIWDQYFLSFGRGGLYRNLDKALLLF